MMDTLFSEWDEQPDQPVQQLLVEVKPPPTYDNPCMALYGKGPVDKQCKDCSQLAGICMAKTYYKCRLRENTHSKATDHKLHWPSCARFEQRTKDIPLYDGRG